MFNTQIPLSYIESGDLVGAATGSGAGSADGGNEGADQTNDQGVEGQGDTSSGNDGGNGGDEGSEDGAQGGASGTIKDLPDWAQAKFRALTDEAAANRVKAKQATEALSAVDAALNPKKVAGSEAPDAAQLAATLAEQTRINVVLRSAKAQNTDGDELLNYVPFVRALSAIDPSDGAAITDLMRTTVQGNPQRFRATVDTARQSGGSGGHRGNRQPAARPGLGSAVAGALADKAKS